MDFRNAVRPISEGDIQKVEINFGIQFPNELREHYKKFNGGHPIQSCYPYDDDFLQIHCFLGINSPDENVSFEHTFQNLVQGNQYWPKHLIPFAYDEGGNYFCFSRAHDEFGEIYFYQSEYAGDSGQENLFLEKNFSAFVAKLRKEN